ncbi:uncharacterized protein MYCFIDRAFT_156359 [Pseudocercospora fijiensis CIRAD86]|uniref:Zn(2)-C6 fungal-type domain-containing protein n=1 Tax=Pseudocercospora fijiensis (strain CIRAD86) TaxID=383855 RepID=M3ANI4_PSEFD|nr:uncharacterized protein MYCFIDRAFT_156359 [Pseudocercospora fijiensis CIRAD86]EME79032.1 hypothetical protein MYCFIDRAFT_156359 [Pseudocercospora fijiensis CIRAD86]
MAVPSLAPRPSPRPTAAWSPPKHVGEGKENRPALKLLQPSSSSQARSKRERPCDACRRRKSKCVLQEGRRCVLCEFHKQECTFVENAQPRKRKAHDASKADHAMKKSSPSSPSHQLPVFTPPTPAAAPPKPISVERQPTPSAGQPSMRKPFVVDESLSLQRHRHCKYLGQTTALDARLIGLGSFNEKNETESQLGSLRQVSRTEYFSTQDDADVSVPDDESRALADVEQVIGSHGPALIDIYFRNVQPSYPIIQKHAFLDRYQHGDRQFNPPLLAAMYMLAMRWWDQDPAVSSHPKPDLARLESIAISSLTAAMHRPKMSAVQAGLLLLQRAKSSTWTLTVQLVALGQDIGLHLDCSDWSIPLWEKKLRKRLAWALYMQDKWSALMHGRPSHINASDWNVPIPTDDDFDETIHPLPTPNEDTDSQASRGRTVFIQMISLTSIMSEVCTTFYSESAKTELSRAGQYATQLALARAKPVQIKLRDWFTKLPETCKIDNFTPSHLAPQGYLHLAYFATEISIHRRIVQSLDPATTNPYMLYICRSAAKTRLISALDFVNRLKPEHLDAFWYFASTANFSLIATFGALLMATSPGKEEAKFYACRLNEFRWTLTVSCKKAKWISGALENLGALRFLLRGVEGRPSLMMGVEEGDGGGVVGGTCNGVEGGGMEVEVEGWGEEEQMNGNMHGVTMSV